MAARSRLTAGAGSSVAERGTRQRLAHDVGGEAEPRRRPDVDHGEADAVDGDGVAVAGVAGDQRADDGEPRGVAGSRSTATTAPSSSTIPVNTQARSSSSGRPRRCGRRARPGATRSRPRRQRRSAPMLPTPGIASAAGPAPSRAGASVPADRVDEPGGDERAGERGAALEQHVLHVARGRGGQRRPRGRGCAARAVGAASSSSRGAAGSGRRPTTTRSGWRVARAPSVSRTVRCGSSASAVPVPTRTASTWARSACTSARASGEVIQRLLPSAAATRPSRVAAAFQVTNGRPRVTAKVQAGLTAAASVGEQPGLDVDAGRAQAARTAGGDRVGVGLAEDDARDAGGEQRLGAGPGPAGVVARLEGDDGGGTAGRRPGRGAGRRPRRAGCRRRGGSPRRRPCRPGRAARSPRAGWGRAARRGWRPAPGRGASRRSRCCWPSSSCLVVAWTACSGGEEGMRLRRGRRRAAGVVPSRRTPPATAHRPRASSHPDSHRRRRMTAARRVADLG